tara:strand:+ start:1176 stop:1349 length:174 start_codon:yes stop_codon:yes gene_type:complete
MFKFEHGNVRYEVSYEPADDVIEARWVLWTFDWRGDGWYERIPHYEGKLFEVLLHIG